jgi:glucose-1-phosphate cytidylyltransferase
VLGIEKYVSGEKFLCTYGDGLSDVNINELEIFHDLKNRIATVTAVRPLSRFGVLELGTSDNVTSFKEKPQAEGWINGGFFIFQPQIFDYLTPEVILEDEPLQALSAKNQLSAFRHEGFWQPMDTFRESKMLNDLWDKGQAPWRTRN